MSEWNCYSNEVKDLIKKMINENPDKRPSINEVLEHPWFSKGLSEDLLEETYSEMEWRKSYMAKYFNKSLG